MRQTKLIPPAFSRQIRSIRAEATRNSRMFGLSGMEIAFLFVLILLAGGTRKLVRLFHSFWRRWARKDLRPGDLIALRGLTIRDGRWSGPYPDRLQRLRERGFIEGHEGDKPSVTMKGRVALLLGQR
jgi:hypothetical protein